MALFVIRPLAQSDIAETYAFIAQSNRARAEEWLEQVEAACQHLALMPQMGRSRPELKPDLRSLSVGKFLIFYRPMTEGVEVLRVLHGSRDLRDPGLFG